MNTQDEKTQKEPTFKTKSTYARGVLPPFKPRQLTDEEIEENLEESHNQRFSANQIHMGRWGNVTKEMDD